MVEDRELLVGGTARLEDWEWCNWDEGFFSCQVQHNWISKDFILKTLYELCSFISVFIICRTLSVMALKWRKLRSKLLEGLRKNRHLLMARQMFSYSSIWKTICILIVVVFLISIPWEFVNLYQKEVAKKTAIVIKVIIICEICFFTCWKNYFLSL